MLNVNKLTEENLCPHEKEAPPPPIPIPTGKILAMPLGQMRRQDAIMKYHLPMMCCCDLLGTYP